MSTRPDILYIMSDDHAAHAISAYGSQINHTPKRANNGRLYYRKRSGEDKVDVLVPIKRRQERWKGSTWDRRHRPQYLQVAAGVQHDPTTQLSWIPTAGAWGDYAQASVGRKSEIISGNDRGVMFYRPVRLRLWNCPYSRYLILSCPKFSQVNGN